MNTVKISTGELSYVDCGTGQTILLVHGFPLDHTMWDAQIEALSPRSRVIAPDLRGFGTSPLGSADPERGISMERYADDLAELLDILRLGSENPVIFVGFSMGGYIAWQFMRKYAARIRALVLCDTRASADTDEARAGRLKMAQKISEWGAARVADMMGPKLVAPKTFESRPAVVSAIRRIVERTAPSAIAAAQRGMAARPDMAAFLSQINAPTLVLVGADDAISPPAEMQSIAAAIPDSEFVIIPNAGHMTTMENPNAVNQATTDFISHLAPGH